VFLVIRLHLCLTNLGRRQQAEEGESERRQADAAAFQGVHGNIPFVGYCHFDPATDIAASKNSDSRQ
jgi:hypothetical protein